MPAVLVIDDDRSVVHLVRATFQATDIAVLSADNAAEGLKLLQEARPDTVLLDIVLPDMSGMEAYQHLRRLDAKIPVIFITAEGSSETAIEATKLGAFDYLTKPLDCNVLRSLVEQTLKIQRLMQVPVKLPDAGVHDDQADLMIGRSPQMLEVYKAIGRVARQDVTVLVRGESGTGKELIARALYQHSSRAEGPFLAVNCAAIPDALLESELFGHEKGAFTSADRRRIGKFEQCTGGTLFLDEVGDMSLLVQSKLLRLLQEQRFERVGGNETIQTDVRIITATNRDLEQMVAEGTFRGDLFYRLNGFTINLPPLRERGDDILLLLERFLSRFARQFERDVHGISPDALKILAEYPWPGNVRELQSVLRTSLLNATGPVLVPEFLPDEVKGKVEPKAAAAAASEAPLSELEAFVDERLRSNSTDVYAEALQMLERCVVTRVLRMTNGNQLKAAARLGISRGSLRTKIRMLGISIGQEVHVEGEDPAESVPSDA
jgi:two-component system nitrogen regulation response regulator GlnG